MLVWRVETNHGVGLYTNCSDHEDRGGWSRGMWASRFVYIPTPEVDFGYMWDETVRYHKRLRFAFPSPYRLAAYVGLNKGKVIKGLLQAGFHIVVLEVDPLLTSDDQVVYDPLYATEIRRLNPRKLYAYTA